MHVYKQLTSLATLIKIICENTGKKLEKNKFCPILLNSTHLIYEQQKI